MQENGGTGHILHLRIEKDQTKLVEVMFYAETARKKRKEITRRLLVVFSALLAICCMGNLLQPPTKPMSDVRFSAHMI